MSLIVAEYRCPVHGVFESLIERPAPDEMLCPVVLGEDELDEFEDVDESCGQPSPWCMSAPKMAIDSVPCYATERGGDMADRPKGMLDTRDLGEGKVTHEQWKAKQRDAQRTRRHKMLVDKGVISKKIQVG